MIENFPEHELDINSHMNEVQKILREIIKKKHGTQNKCTEKEFESPIMKTDYCKITIIISLDKFLK